MFHTSFMVAVATAVSVEIDAVAVADVSGADMKATIEPSALMDGNRFSSSLPTPPALTLTSSVTPLLRSRTKTSGPAIASGWYDAKL